MRNTWEGNGTENSAAKSISSRSINPSIRLLTVALTESSMRAICLGAKMGSRILRYFLCSGGSIWSGIIGRLFLRSTASALDEKTSG